MYAVPTGSKISVVEGDLTLEAVDAIVNATNEHLSHGGGVAWAIVRRGHPG
jgi:O-acetyl-ADP-ribose deacetylase (regulator of RNase III)